MMQILIAEDDPISQTLLQKTLDGWGHQVHVCHNGVQALEVLSQPTTPRLAILDWMMPKLSGPNVCRQMRQFKHGPTVYIIMLTVRDKREDLIEGLDAGADDYMTKPFNRQELKARLKVGERVLRLQDTLLEAERTRIAIQTAGATAHEINQPLTVARGRLDLLLMRLEKDFPYYEDIEAVQLAAKQIEKIVKDMSNIRQFVSKSYINGVDIIDIEASSSQE